MDKPYNIGVLLVDNAGDGLTQDFFASIINTFKNTVENRGYCIIFLNSADRSCGRPSYLEQVRKHNIEALLLACIKPEDKEVQELIAAGLPIVVIDEKLKAPNVRMISSDNTSGMGKLVDYAVSKGHTRIAYIYGDYNYVTKIRINGFTEACKKNGIDIPEDYLLPGNFRDTGKASYFTDYLLRLQDPPTCIFYSDDLTAISGMNTIRARGLEVGQDVSVAGYDGIRIAMQYEPRLSTIRQRTDKMGLAAAYSILEMIESPDSADMSDLVVDVDLEEGRTIK